MAKEFSITELQKELRKINPFGDTMDKSEFSKITEWIDTGNYHLNAVFSGDLFGGIPNNRTICLAGDSGCVQKNQKIRIYKIKSNLYGATRNINNG